MALELAKLRQQQLGKAYLPTSDTYKDGQIRLNRLEVRCVLEKTLGSVSIHGHNLVRAWINVCKSIVHTAKN